MKRVKILHIITRLAAGGAQRIAASIAGTLDRDKYEVTFASGLQDFCKDIKDEWNIDVTIIPNLVREINPLKDLIALIRLYFFIKKNRFDIVHTYTSKAGILGRVAAKLAGVPIILHSPRGSIFHSVYYGPKARFLLRRLENFAASFTDKIITCSEDEKKDYLENRIGTRDKYITIYSGLKEDDFLKSYDGNSKRRELGISDDAILIGSVARLAPEKGHIFCLEAFRMLADKFPKVILLVVGGGPLRRDVEAKIDGLGLNNNVVMTGHRGDVLEIFASLDISLHTSMWEGLPRTIIEAMFMGKPIIATKVGGIPELIEDGITGILIQPNDKEALVSAVATLINDKSLAKRFGDTARVHAKEKFGLGTMIKNMTDLYSALIKSKGM